MPLFAPLIFSLVALGVQAGTLDRPDEVDLIEFDAATSQATLVILLGDDRVNSRATMNALFKKVNRYLDFVNSGQFKGAVPPVSAVIRPRVVVYAPRDASSAELQNLAGLKLAAKRSGVEVEVLSHRPGISPRPVSIEPRPQRGA